MSDESIQPIPEQFVLPPPAWKALTVSVRGFNHERSGQENQDAGGFHLEETPGGPLFLSLADGHGSHRSFRSATGSALAVKAAIEQLHKLIFNQNPQATFKEKRAQAMNEWPQALVQAWHGLVREDILAKPFTFYDFAPFPEPQPVINAEDKELPLAAALSYGATMLAVAITADYILYAQLGDGDILTVLPDGRVRRPFLPQHARLATSTPSLCSQNAELGVRVAVRPRHEKSPVLILISTDGYANSFADEAAFRQVGIDLLNYLRTEGLESVRSNLTHWLHSASVNGTGDDITLGLMVREDILTSEPVRTEIISDVALPPVETFPQGSSEAV